MLDLVRNGGDALSVALSDVARVVFFDDWPRHLEETREVASELRDEGLIQFCLRGRPADVHDHFRGPLRLKSAEGHGKR